jgi:hypothetical protein
MANIVIREVLASDTVSDLVDKINFNFDQLLLNGGGPLGLTGSSGPLGPQGPRGSIWFTLYDIYNTSSTTTSISGLYYPTWDAAIGAERVNDEANPGFPQWKGDPNRYQPSADTSSPNTYPEYSFIIGNTTKVPRSGDFYLQEGDDTFDGYTSYDGDVWEYSGVAGTWSFSGVNIKGGTGTTGASGNSNWDRFTDNNSTDILTPRIDTGNNASVRTLIGSNDLTVITESDGKYTTNTLTIFQDSANALNGYQISLTDDTSVNNNEPTDVYARIGTNNNVLNIEGFDDPTGSVTDRDIFIKARSGRVELDSFNTLAGNIYNSSAVLDIQTRSFELTDGELHIFVDPTTLKSGSAQRVEHSFTDGEVKLQIIHNQSTTYGDWSNKSIRINSIGSSSTGSDIIFQDVDWSNGISNVNNRSVGIGSFSINRPPGRLTVTTGSLIPGTSLPQPAFVTGPNWSATNPTISTVAGNTSSNVANRVRGSAYIQGGLSVGTGTPGETPVMYGISSIQALGNFTFGNSSIIGFNSYIDISDITNPTAAATLRSTTTSIIPYFIGSGNSLIYNISGSNQNDLVNKFIIGGSSSAVTAVAELTGNLQGNQKFNVNLIVDSAQNRVGINTTYLQTSLNSFGGAVIGKTLNFTSSSSVGNYTEITSRNIIIGHQPGNTSNDPYLKLTNTADDDQISDNSIYLATQVFHTSMRFDGNSANELAVFSVPVDTFNYLPSISPTYKIVHGRPIVKTGYTGQLSQTSNPYLNGIGLAIESRIDLTGVSTASDGVTRGPILRTGGSPNAEIYGNRALVIYRNDSVNGIESTLLSVTPFGNTSIGRPITYPSLAVRYLNQPGANATSSPIDIAPIGTANTTNGLINLNSLNAGKWTDLYPSETRSIFTLPYDNLSLNVNRIEADDSNPYSYSINQDNIDYHHHIIDAGILINTNTWSEGIDPQVGNPDPNVNDAYTSYHFNLVSNPYDGTFQTGYYKPQIDTGILLVKDITSSTTKPSVTFKSPLKFRNGTVVYAWSGNTNKKATAVKGGDIIISGGDVVYNTLPTKSARAGDVYIHGGLVYQGATGGFAFQNVINGAVSASQSISGSSYNINEKRNVGDIFIGSRPDPDATNGLGQGTPGSQGVIKSGNVYIGYQTQSQIWNNTTTTYSPKGSAALNVAAADDSTVIYSDGIKNNGKALNIQLGDIVTKNQDAGWQVINLATSQFFFADNMDEFEGVANGLQCLRAYWITTRGFDANGKLNAQQTLNSPIYWDNTPLSGSNYGGLTLQDAMQPVKPIWEIRYKVIGYTVHFKISMQSILFRTPPQPIVNNASPVILFDGQTFFSGIMGGLFPKVDPSTTAAAYQSVTTYVSGAPEGNRPIYNSFSATGQLVWRNARHLYRAPTKSFITPSAAGIGVTVGQSYPVNTAGGPMPGTTPITLSQNSPILSTPIRAIYESTSTNLNTGHIYIYKSGTPVFPQFGQTDPNAWRHHSSTLRLINGDGLWEPASTSAGAVVRSTGGRRMLQYDLYLEGTYELDPSWFNT